MTIDVRAPMDKINNNATLSAQVESIKDIIDSSIQDKLFPACVVGVVNRKGERIVVPGGRYTFEEDAPTVKEDSIFDVASITKVLPTASLALQAIDQGKLRLDDKVIEFVPQLNNQYKNEITILHLLTQTLNFGIRMSQYRDNKPNEILETIFNAKLISSPGEDKFYSGATSILLGLVVEKVFKKKIDTLLSEHFTTPLRMTRTHFNPLTRLSKDQIVPSQNDSTWRKRIIQGEIHDGASYTLSKEINCGAAGLFSTVPDLLNFIEVVLHNGTFNHTTYFSKESIALMQKGSTWDVAKRTQIGSYPSDSTISKTGFTGTIIIADIEHGIGISILTNYIYSQDTNDTTLDVSRNVDRFQLLNDFRIKIIDCVYG